jgi:replicative DNA helicase
LNADRLPRDHDAERLALGCIIAFPECAPDVFGKLYERDFIDPGHKAIYAAMLDQRSRGLGVDPPLLAAELKGHPAFEDGNPGGYMMELAQNATPAHVDYYAGLVRDASLKRYLRSIGEAVIDGAGNGRAPAEIVNALLADVDEYQRETSSVKECGRLAETSSCSTSHHVSG